MDPLCVAINNTITLLRYNLKSRFFFKWPFGRKEGRAEDGRKLKRPPCRENMAQMEQPL